MNSIKKCVVSLSVALLLQACAIPNYQVINKINDASVHKISEPCEIKFSISLVGVSFLRTNAYGGPYFGSRENTAKKMSTLKNQYIDATSEALRKKSCIATYVENEEQADIKVQVNRTINENYGNGVGLIGGLTLGLFPIWGTQHGQFTFTFDNTKANTTHSYVVDENFYIHLFFMPIFWAFELDEIKPYTESLIDFVENCNAECK